MTFIIDQCHMISMTLSKEATFLKMSTKYGFYVDTAQFSQIELQHFVDNQ